MAAVTHPVADQPPETVSQDFGSFGFCLAVLIRKSHRHWLTTPAGAVSMLKAAAISALV